MDAAGTEQIRVPTRRSHYGVASPEKRGMTIERRDGIVVLGMGEIEIWDSADLALLRDTLVQLIDKRRCIAVGIDIRYVKGLPSGFFGMLCSWLESRGVNAVYLFSPQPSIREMLWFRLFFQLKGGESYVMLRNPKSELLGDGDEAADPPAARDLPDGEQQPVAPKVERKSSSTPESCCL